MALTRFNDYVMFANAILSDKTSTIKLTLWNGRIETVSVNDVVQIENASVVLFRGELQLKMGRTSTLKVLDKDGLTADSTEEGLKA
jgi:ssDNA-binding replication factor A large subunit